MSKKAKNSEGSDKIIEIVLSNDKSPDFYKHYPRLFTSYFNSKEVTRLSKAGYFLYLSIILSDMLVDNKRVDLLKKILVLQEKALIILYSIFNEDSIFWKTLNSRRNEYFEAIKIEKSLPKLEIVDFDIYQDLADKKAAYGKVAIDSLYILQQKKDDDAYQKLLLSHKYFSVGFQLYDDVKDFKEDFESGQFNYAIDELKKKVNFNHHKQNVEILNKLLFIKQIGQDILSKSIEQFDKAITILYDLKIQSEWLKVVIDMKTTIESYLYVINGYMASITTRLELKKQISNTHSFLSYTEILDPKIKAALDFIRRDFQQNYADLKHIMYLGQLEGFDNDKSIHVTDTFQRALINDCFTSVASVYKLNIHDFLKSECQYLINLRNIDGIGGWSYFPTVKEIAADIDDLGQMIQLFALLENYNFIDKFCQKAISIALNECTLTNGGIETWIIPKKTRTKVQKRQDYFNATKWGKGPDVEVVANFIYSLVIIDKKKYRNPTNNALSYILEQQNNKGYWESRWYYGNYYGTYVCLRLLKEFESDYPKVIQKTLSYLIISQNNDGGFSIEKNSESDALSTSFAILGLKLFLANDNKTIKRAIKYLSNTQNKDGSWNAIDFIKPKVHEPYKSKTISTAYVLKALCS